jgi:hypothetical protein
MKSCQRCTRIRIDLNDPTADKRVDGTITCKETGIKIAYIKGKSEECLKLLYKQCPLKEKLYIHGLA